MFCRPFVLICVVMSGAAAVADDIAVHVSFEPSRDSIVVPSGASLSSETPGSFLYDPITRRSHRNEHSLDCTGGDEPVLELNASTLKLNGSFTVECYLKPTEAREAAAVAKLRQTEDAASWSLGLDPFWAHNQWYFKAGVVGPKSRGQQVGAGYYGSTAQWKGKDDPDGWRHLALVWNAGTKKATVWIDHYLSGSESATDLQILDDGAFVIGGPKFAGLVDEIRVTRRALGPAEFLRARDADLSDVSFISNQQILPRDSGALDVKEHFGAVGDGVTDDTAAFQRAFDRLPSRVPLAYHTLLIPPGRYLITQRLHCSRFIDVKGAGPDQTVLVLKDSTFTDPQQPQPVLRMSSTAGDPGSHDWTNGSSISIYLDGLTIDTGRNNPGAKALEYHSNNIGRLENVVLRSGDGPGVIGLDLTHHDVGPALIKNVTVEGFDHATVIRYQEYSMTFEHFRIRGQRVAGILNQGNILAIRGLVSENTVPAIISEGANSMVTLIDSSLTGGAGDQPAIKSDGALYALRVTTAGYGRAVDKRVLLNQEPQAWRDEVIAGPDLDESIGDNPVQGFGEAAGALRLTIEETPEPSVPPISEWASVATFADKVVDDDWSPALQAAIDSGAKVVYLPTTLRAQFGSPVHVRGSVERLMGFGKELRWKESAWKESHQREQRDDANAPPPLLIFDDVESSSPRTVVLDRLSVHALQHNSTDTLVLRSSSVDRYTTAKAGGRLFIEDAGGADWHFDHPQHVWVRQWNPESHAAGPCIQNNGATLWVLGFKTEYESSKLWASRGARTEILGAFIYPIGEIPEDRPIFRNTDSDMALIYGTSVYHANHHVHIIDSRTTPGGQLETRSIGNDSLRRAGSRARMDLFTTRGTSGTP